MRPPAQKVGKAARDPAYLDAVRQLPCCICEAFGEVQMSPTTAHHPIHARHSNERVPDREAIPLCDGHHQGTFDRSKLAIHRGKKTWRAKYGCDRDYIAQTQDKVEDPSR
jgi:hypothetical protein